MYHPLDYMYLRRDERYGLVYIKRDRERERERERGRERMNINIQLLKV